MASSAAISLLYGAARLEGGLEGPVVGYLISKFGCRTMIFTGASMAGAGLILLTTTHSFWAFFFPVAVLVQFVFTMGLCFLVSALTVHFRDLKDILANLLTLWFFGTPIIYSLLNPEILKHKLMVFFLNLNPMTHIIEAYQTTFVYRSLPHWKKLPVTFFVGLIFFYLGYLLFDKLRNTFVEEV